MAYQSPYNEDGSFAEVQGSNPLAAIEYNNSSRNQFRALGNFYAEFNFLEDFEFKTSYQFDLSNNKKPFLYSGIFCGSTSSKMKKVVINIGFGESRNWIFENTLSFNKEIGRSTINSVIGYTSQEINSEFINGGRRNLIGVDPSLWYLDAGSEDLQTNSNGGATSALTLNFIQNKLTPMMGVIWLLSLSEEMVLLDLVKIIDMQTSPAVALGWNISNEAFYPSDFVVNQLKLRGSYGLNGNQNISWQMINSLELDQVSIPFFWIR